MTKQGAESINRERNLIFATLTEMEMYIDQTRANLTEYVTPESKSIDHANLSRFLAIQQRVIEAINRHDVAIAWNIKT